MTQFALVERGVVKELFPANPGFAPTVPIVNVSSVAGIAVGWTENNGAFSAPVTTVSGAANLQTYAFQKQAGVAGGGLTVNVGTQGAPINVKASTDPASLVLLQGAYSLAQANAGAAFNWVQDNGAPVTLTAAQIITMFNAVTAFMQATFTTLAGVIAGINAAPPTITTQAQVDTPPAPTAAWPINS